MSTDSALSASDVSHLARLARLDLTDDESARYATQLGQILHAVERVSEVAADDVEPMSHPQQVANVARPDVLRECLRPEQALAAAPASEDQRFRVPRILDEA